MILGEGVYVGRVRNGLRDGEGIFTDDAGAVYTGSWSLDKPHGFGIKTSLTGSKYEGMYTHGTRHGSGRYTFPSGDMYVGQFHNGTMSGKGTMTWAVSGAQYSGQWRDGLMDGKGMKIEADAVVDGSFRRGRVHGWAIKSFSGATPGTGGDSHVGNYWEVRPTRRNGALLIICNAPIPTHPGRTEGIRDVPFWPHCCDEQQQ